jgi:hypothetical protein
MATSQNGRSQKNKTHQDWGFKFHLLDFPSHTAPALDTLQRALQFLLV